MFIDTNNMRGVSFAARGFVIDSRFLDYPHTGKGFHKLHCIAAMAGVQETECVNPFTSIF